VTPVVIIDEDDLGRYGTGKSNLHPRVQQEVENDAMKHETTNHNPNNSNNSYNIIN
jgi:hypothetical protein